MILNDSRKDRQIKILSTALIIAAVLFSLLPLLTLIIKEQAMLRYEKAFIGRIHERLPEQEAEIMAALFRTEITEEAVKIGEQVLEDQAYTERGSEELQKKLRSPGEILLALAAGLLCCAVLAVLIFRLRERIFSVLQDKNRELTSRQKELDELSALSNLNQRLREFIENIAHQLKTPLSRLMTSLELLQESGTSLDAPQITTRISECITHIESTQMLVDRLLTIGRLEAGEVVFSSELMSLSLLFEEILQEYPENQCAVLRTEPQDARFFYHGSLEWLREAFINILDNAEIYGSGSQPPVLMLEELPEEYRITLRDYGPGFSDEDLPYLFDRFYRTQEMLKGHVGLGLNLTKLIIEGHKGTIHAENHPEGGALFTILLPRLDLMK